MAWFKQKKLCIHCNSKKTRRTFEEQPCCADCEIEIRTERESVISCPLDGTAMVKEQYEEIIIDRCPNCKGVWLDAGELKAIQTAASADADFATGMVIGMAMG